MHALQCVYVSVLELQAGAKGFQISNVPVLECCCLQASLGVFGKTSMKQLVHKSRFLTGYLELLLETCLESDTGEGISGEDFTIMKWLLSFSDVKIVTSSDPARRGNQLSLHFESCSLSNIHDRLTACGVVVGQIV